MSITKSIKFLIVVLFATGVFCSQVAFADFNQNVTDTYNDLTNVGLPSSQGGVPGISGNAVSGTLSSDNVNSGVPDVSTMLSNIATTVPQLMQLVTAIAYVLGIVMIFRAVVGFKHFGEMRSAMSHNESLKGPMAWFFIGAALLVLPSVVATGITTFFPTDNNPYGYPAESSDDWCNTVRDAFIVIQLIGTIALIRGLLQLGRVGHHAQQGSFAKGLTFIIAGILCIDLWDFLGAIDQTLGIQGLNTGICATQGSASPPAGNTNTNQSTSPSSAAPPATNTTGS